MYALALIALILATPNYGLGDYVSHRMAEWGDVPDVFLDEIDYVSSCATWKFTNIPRGSEYEFNSALFNNSTPVSFATFSVFKSGAIKHCASGDIDAVVGVFYELDN